MYTAGFNHIQYSVQLSLLLIYYRQHIFAFLIVNGPFPSLFTITKHQARYNTFGKLNAANDNLLVVCHALTGNSRLDQWWGTMLGKEITLMARKFVNFCTKMLKLFVYVTPSISTIHILFCPLFFVDKFLKFIFVTAYHQRILSCDSDLVNDDICD